MGRQVEKYPHGLEAFVKAKKSGQRKREIKAGGWQISEKREKGQWGRVEGGVLQAKEGRVGGSG